MSRYKRYSNPYSVDVQRYSIYGNQSHFHKRSGLQMGDEFTITVKEMDNNGRGIGFRNGKKVIIPRAVPGEKIRIRIVKVDQENAYAAVIERLEEPKR